MSARRILSCILLPAYLSSCTSWHVQRASPAQVVQEEHPSQIRVTTTGHSVVILEAPRLSGDTLIGLGPRNAMWAGSVYAVSDNGSMLAIPLADISHVALKKSDSKAALIGLGAILGLVIVICADGKCAPDIGVGTPR